MAVRIGSAADYAGVFVDGSQEAVYVAKVLALSPTAYWILGEHLGATAYEQINAPAQNGTHVGVTLGNAGIGDGQVCPLYNGANNYTNIYSATLAAAVTSTVGTMAIWAKVSGVGVWADGVFRKTLSLFVNGNNWIFMDKSSAANSLRWFYIVGGAARGGTVAVGAVTTWMHLSMTWDVNAGAAGELNTYYNGAVTGLAVAQNLAGGFGAFTGGAVGMSDAVSRVHPWSGYLAHAALWNSVLTPAQIASLATV